MQGRKSHKVVDVIQHLKREIESGVYQTKGIITSIVPPHRQLAKQFDTTLDTITRAIANLQAQGLVLTSGRNIIVNPVKLSIPGVTPSFDSFLVENDLTPYFENVGEPEIIEMDKEQARAFNLEPGTRVVRRLRLQGEIRHDKPQAKEKTTKNGNGKGLIIWYRLAETMYDLKLIEQVGGQAWIEEIKTNPRFNIIKEIEKKTGQKVTHASSELVPRFPNLQEQELLNISYQTPVIEHWRKCYSDDGTLIMFNRIVLVSYAFRFSFDYPISI